MFELNSPDVRQDSGEAETDAGRWREPLAIERPASQLRSHTAQRVTLMRRSSRQKPTIFISLARISAIVV